MSLKKSHQPSLTLAQAFQVGRGEVIAITGGGGKTTAMFRLAQELVQLPANPWRVLTTTTTRIFAAQTKRSPAHVSYHADELSADELWSSLEPALAAHHQVLLTGHTKADSDKAFGVSPEIIDRLAQTGRFDLIIIEADGSRMRPFKAPAAHEPVIPAAASLVVPVVGIDVVDQPLNDQTVHRAELVSQLSQIKVGRPLTGDAIAKVLCHPQGGLKNVPEQARVVPLLNKVESETRLNQARRIAANLLACDRIDSVVIGAVQAAGSPVIEVWARSAVIILAAGGSTRFGSPKQLARRGHQTFIERAVEVALTSQADPVIVVLGAETGQSRQILQDKPVQIVTNPRWGEGQSSSLQAGLAQLPPNVGSAVFHLVDLPEVTPDVIDALIERHRQTLAPLVWPEFEGKRGNPVLFDRTLFPELMQIEGDTGGKPVLMRYKDRSERVAVAGPGILQDIDHPHDQTAA